MQKIKVEYLYEETVVRVILDDGKANILDGIMMGEINDLLVSLKDKKDVKLITFEGAGNNFSYGASVAEHTKDKAAAMLEGFHRMFFSLISLHIPTLAKLSGQCLGGGFELPLACNFIFAVKSAKIGQPEVILGVFAPPASVMLPLKVGNAKAEELLITGKIISAEEAKSWGVSMKSLKRKMPWMRPPTSGSGRTSSERALQHCGLRQGLQGLPLTFSC
jgi:cyclohexa-1,5-dienecarbonyl-CoA hydratase